jgi:monovalent cation:H+ antiporter, CPA1 family
MDVITLVGIVAALFIVISLSEPLADWRGCPTRWCWRSSAR